MQFFFLSNGNVIDHYPYITPDGFDWYTEGVYLVRTLQGFILPPLFVLRSPGFVLVTALDFAIGRPGLVIGITYGAAIFFTYYFALRLIDLSHDSFTNTFTQNSKQPQPKQQWQSWYAIPLAIGFTVYSVNFFRPFLLSDGMATCLTVMSIFLLAKTIASKNINFYFLLAILSASLAALTQTYAVMPFEILCVILIFQHFKSNKNNRFKYLGAAFTVPIIVFVLSWLWRLYMPHEIIPKPFDLLALNLNMTKFYKNTWGFYILPFILIWGIFCYVNPKKIFTNIITQHAIVTTIVMMFFCFFYQWKEARFTYYFWPWLLIGLLSFLQPRNRACLFAGAIFMTILEIGVPQTYWDPTLRLTRLPEQIIPRFEQISLNPSENWLLRYFRGEPINRAFSSCNPNCAIPNEFLSRADPYTQKTLTVFFQIKNLKK